SPLLSLRHAMQLACTHFRLTPEEALRGATVNGARALGLHDRGALRVGLGAAFVHWNITHPAELCYWLGGTLVRAVYADGHQLCRDPALRRPPRMIPRPVLLLALALCAGVAHADDATLQRPAALARDAIIVDTHIDAPGILAETWADLGEPASDREFDYPRARAGGLDVAFMSIYTSAREDVEGKARQSAHAQIDSIEAL